MDQILVEKFTLFKKLLSRISRLGLTSWGIFCAKQTKTARKLQNQYFQDNIHRSEGGKGDKRQFFVVPVTPPTKENPVIKWNPTKSHAARLKSAKYKTYMIK